MPESLPDALAALADAHGALSSPPTTEEVARWMEALYGAFRAGRASTGALPPELRDHAARTAAQMRRLFGQHARYLSALEATLFDLDRHEDWARVCRRRSVVEVVRDLYADPADDEAPFVGVADPEPVDDLIRQLAERWGYLRDSEVPPGIPASHWWWWAPAPPPAHREEAPHP